MKNLKDTIYWLFSIMCGVFIAYLLIGGIIKKRSLDKNLEYSKAMVIDHFYTIRYTDYFSYEFFVEEKKYQGSGKHYPTSDALSVGDTITVVYDKTNPDNNRSARDYR
ncbi:MAG: hypothetical protein PHH23_00595 [Paludibacteraceae bacterium]|nr:hypothetical protein [Paludibacteraceae bacterium]